MRLDWLKDIVSIAETGSFLEAAQRRRVTPSAFSRRVQLIEDHLGVELFDRSKKPVQLRPTTADHLDQMAELIGQLTQLADDLRRGDRMTGNRLAIASQHALTTALTPSLLSALHLTGDGVHIRLISANRDDCTALLLSRQADLTITYTVAGEAPVEGESFIETKIIGTDRLIPVFSAAHADVLETAFAAGELPLITYPSDVFFGRVMNLYLLPGLEPGIRFKAQAECELTLAVMELAGIGIGVAWIPESVGRAHLAEGRLISLADRLGTLDLLVAVTRLATRHTPTEQAVWRKLMSHRPRAASDAHPVGAV